MKLVQELLKCGQQKGMCHKFQRELVGDLSYQRIAELYFKGMDFCVKADYPSLEFCRSIQEHLPEVAKHGVYVDAEVQDLHNVEKLCFLGDCKALVSYNGFSVGLMYARHNTQAAVNVSDNAILRIDAFENTHLVVAVAGNNAEVVVNLYGDASVETIGTGIKVIHKNKTTY